MREGIESRGEMKAPVSNESFFSGLGGRVEIAPKRPFVHKAITRLPRRCPTETVRRDKSYGPNMRMMDDDD